MNHGAGAGNKKLIDLAERHRAFRKRDALHREHFLISAEKQIDLAFDGNAKRIFYEGVLPSVHVSFFRSEGDIFAFRKRGSFGDVDGLRGAGLDAFAREAVGGGKSPGAAGDHANTDAERFGFEQIADFPVFGGDFALAGVHHARIGVGGAAKLRSFNTQGGPVEHHAREILGVTMLPA